MPTLLSYWVSILVGRTVDAGNIWSFLGGTPSAAAGATCNEMFSRGNESSSTALLLHMAADLDRFARLCHKSGQVGWPSAGLATDSNN